MNSIIEAQIKKFAKEHSIENVPLVVLFEQFTIFAVEEGLLNSRIEIFDAHLSGSEFGIDGVAIIVHGELITDVEQLEDNQLPIDRVEFHFFQSKTGTSFKTGEIAKFFDAIEDFFKPKYKSKSADMMALKKVKDYILEHSENLEESPTLRAYFATTGNYKSPSEVEESKARFVGRLQDTSIFSNIEVAFVGASDLQEWFRAASRTVKSTISFEKVVTLPVTKTVAESYIGYIPASELINLVTNPSSGTLNRSVFYENIRDFNPDTEINQSITESLNSGEAELFVFRNNGITVVAKKILRVGDKFTVSDYQVVNGCQTSHILYENRANIDGVCVPLKLIEANVDADIASIIVGTNLQNPVKKEQFWALTKFMKDLEEYCAHLDADEILYIERRDSQYRGMDVEKAKIIPPNILLKAVASFLLFVGNRAGRAYAGVFKEYSERLFLDGHETAVYHLAGFSHYRLELFLRKKKIDKRYKMFRYFILTGLGTILTDQTNLIDMNNNTAKVKAKKIIEFIKNDKKFQSLLDNITKKIDSVIDWDNVETSNLRDIIKTDAVSKELQKVIGEIKNPL